MLLRPPGAPLTGWLGPSGLVLALAASAAGPILADVPADTLYGSGVTEIVTLDQHDGSITSLAPQSMNLSGLAFDSTGRLFATGCATGFPSCNSATESLLLELDPVTGTILDTIGTVTEFAGSRPAIFSLAVQPGTDILSTDSAVWAPHGPASGRSIRRRPWRPPSRPRCRLAASRSIAVRTPSASTSLPTARCTTEC